MGCHTNSRPRQRCTHKSVQMRRCEPQTALHLVDWGERGVVVRVCVAVCCCVLQCIAVCCSVVNSDLVDRGERGSEMRVCCRALQCVTVCYSVL